MTMPNFLVIGAQKSGTSSLHYYLGQHPEIFMSALKEPGFFYFAGRPNDFRGPYKRFKRQTIVTTEEAYRKLFQNVRDEKAIGESTPVYMFASHAAEQIHRYLPGAGLIAILRHPADRAYSEYLMRLRDGVEPCGDFREALRDQPRSPGDQSEIGDYLQRGFYHAQLTRYFGLFSRQQILVSLYDDLLSDPAGLMRNIFSFLGVHKDFAADLSERHNVSGMVRNPGRRAFWKHSRALRDVVRPVLPPRLRHAAFQWATRDTIKPPLSPEFRAELTETYREDILRLQDLIQRDLSHWLEAEQRTGGAD